MAQGMSTVIVEFKAKPGQRDALAAALSVAITHTVDDPQCYRADLVLDEDDADALLIYEEWANADAHKAYAKALMSSPKAAELMALMAGPPVSRYFAHQASGHGDWGGPQHLELSSEDPAATMAFLGSVFGWRFQNFMEGYDGFFAPRAIMGGVRPKMAEEPCPQAIPYLVVNDLEARLEAVTAAGGTITVPIQEIPHAGRFFWFIAPGGLQLAVWQSTPKG